jgi:hypothetical protein
VKQFFFSRFKRRLIKKSIIDKILEKIIKYTIETELLMRGRTNKIYAFSYLLITSKTFRQISLLIILSNTIVLGLVHEGASQKYNLVLE